ncbi:hypothetical protein EMCRGX_G024822 [Ephydatia muelleri]
MQRPGITHFIRIAGCYGMDVAQARLKQVTDELVSSSEWRELNREFLMQLEQAQYLCGHGELTAFSLLSSHDKVAALSKATKAFGGDQCGSKLSGDAAKNASRACGHLLERWPNLVDHLKRYLNHPLPSDVRSSAWRARLTPARRRVGRNDAVTSSAAAPDGLLPERSAQETRLCQTCETILRSKPVYAALSDSIGVLKAMKGVALLSHRANPSNVLTDADLLICIPFLYARREELGRHSHDSDGVFFHLVVDIADQYETFMRIRPMTMSASNESAAIEALDEFETQVKHLLSSEDPSLRHFLSSMLHRETGSARKRLKNLIQPFIQRMFVGDVSMDVLCFIWDQCFIGMDTMGYQCLPYITATWLILLREKLMSCTLHQDLEKVLMEDSQQLTVWQFQKEIAHRFLPTLSAILQGGQVTSGPSDRREGPQAGTSDTRHPVLRASEPQMTPVSTSHSLMTSTDRVALTRRISEMEEELKLKQRQLESALARGRHFDQPRGEASELPPRNAKATRRSLGPIVEHSASSLSETNSLSAVATPLVRDTRPKKTIITSQLSATSSFTGSRHHAALVGPRAMTSVSESVGEEHIAARPFSPTHLTNKDAQDIWIRIFERFTEAANLLCHGENAERDHAST